MSGKIDAPDLSGGVSWLNVNQPLTLAQLRGKVVLLDFWTFCCINCIHVIPDLKRLERKYPRELAVIGVHSAKFVNEKDTENIRNAILRYEIEHPVINDADFVIWRKYGAQGWPHLAVIDPDGKVVGSLSGEGNYEILDYIIGALINKFEGRLNPEPIPLLLEKEKEPPAVLAFPGKVLAEGNLQRLFISDSNHNRIVISDFDGNITDIAGSGAIGLKDGAFAEAEFNHPQGMVWDGEALLVADTENHALRRVDLKTKTVTTIAGIGQQSRTRNGGPARTTALNSPWDLTRIGNNKIIYIAMAGPHQLWKYDPEKEIVEPYAGSGREDIIDGPLKSSALAQPSGICSDGVNLYFADSEVSALRWVDREKGNGQVKTYIGTGLFDFGDRDGDFDQALLQHPLGVAYHDGKIYVADSYNHKIKVADPVERTITTLAGNGKAGIGMIDAPQFDEPAGLSIAGDNIYVADTNNHAIRVINLITKKTTTLHLDISSWHMQQTHNVFEIYDHPETIILDQDIVAAEGRVELTLDFPEKHHLNTLAEPIVQMRVKNVDGQEWISDKFNPDVTQNAITFPIQSGSIGNPQSIEIAVTFFYCGTDNQGQCKIASLVIESPFVHGNDTTKINYSIRS
ncbi:MAG: hypothetical protein C4527_23805 [Candidatus Omnitrophota bacterium]|nr:MAG: hypothetical protein C4527_23805 [Candidatus Omnitrophota bacterium]